MSFTVIAIISIVYLAFLFFAAYYSEKNQFLRKRLFNSSLVYALSLGVYCTAWTFYGSVGRAATTGLGFLGVYLGPTLLAPLWIFFLKKIIRISKYLRITSIADFISSRYGKSTALGVLVSIICIFIIVPYVSIQLKALAFSVSILHDGSSNNYQIVEYQHFYRDPALLFTLSFALFAIFFGTSKLDPSEKHPGVVNVMALESLIKLLCFLVGAVAIIYFVFDGVEDIFEQAYKSIDLAKLTTVGPDGLEYYSWFWVMVLSAFAFILLPRQFHMAVVENNHVDHVEQASWLTPLYLLLISILVLPVAFAGILFLGNGVEADTYLLSIPIENGMYGIAIIVFIGGLAAVSGMIVISVISLSIMISNNVFLPILLRLEKQYKYFLKDLNSRLLQMRRVLIIFVLIVSYGFYKAYSINYSIVSVGLISFAGIAQLAPLVFFGLYWKYSNEKGAIAGLVVGIVVWFFTLPFVNLTELGVVSDQVLTDGLFRLGIFRPTALFGLEGLSPIAHGSFWSLSFNVLTLVVVSMSTNRSPLEIAQSDIFLNPEKYYQSTNSRPRALVRQANYQELTKVLATILGRQKLGLILQEYFEQRGIKQEPEFADSDFINHIENFLSGSIGSASAKVVLNHIVEQQPVDTEELIKLLDQTYQVFEYSQLLENKSQELSERSKELREANQQLKELDELKNEFISNVTHELRTPITTIRSLAAILKKYDVTDAEKEKFLNIINEESERISGLVNQVLDLRKIEAKPEFSINQVNLGQLIDGVVTSFSEIKQNRKVEVKGEDLELETDATKLKQILINLISNAIKFTDSDDGEIQITYTKEGKGVSIEIKDNGIGIKPKDQEKIFDRFYQAVHDPSTKTKGSGLGLAICRDYIEALGGEITVESKIGKGSTFRIKI